MYTGRELAKGGVSKPWFLTSKEASVSSKQVLIPCALLMTLTPTALQAAISDFFVANSQGVLYEVDGSTLAATKVMQLSNSSNINEIMYLGDDRLMYNVRGALEVVDLSVGTSKVVFDFFEHLPSGFHLASGLSQNQSGEVIVSMSAPAFELNYTGVIDIQQQEFVGLAELGQGRVYQDIHQVNDELYLGAASTGRIDQYNPKTGEVFSELSLAFHPSSFFQADGTVYSIGESGTLFTYDFESNFATHLGEITGTDGALIGATVPSSSPLMVLATAGLGFIRRKR